MIKDIKFHEMIQSYFNKCYGFLDDNTDKLIKSPTNGNGNEIYGEAYYYSVNKLLKYLKLTQQDHFLDLGSGLGKTVFQIFLTTQVASAIGVEINQLRHNIACKVKENIVHNLPELFNENRKLDLINNNFLNMDCTNITVMYACSTVFSFDLLRNISNKINNGCPNLRAIISYRKLPELKNFKLIKNIFLHTTWDFTRCYLYKKW